MNWPVETFEISDRLKFDMGEDLFIELLNYFLIVKLIMFYFHFKIRLYQYCFVKQYLAFLKTCGTVTLYTLSFFFRGWWVGGERWVIRLKGRFSRRFLRNSELNINQFKRYLFKKRCCSFSFSGKISFTMMVKIINELKLNQTYAFPDRRINILTACHNLNAHSQF